MPWIWHGPALCYLLCFTNMASFHDLIRLHKLTRLHKHQPHLLTRPCMCLIIDVASTMSHAFTMTFGFTSWHEFTLAPPEASGEQSNNWGGGRSCQTTKHPVMMIDTAQSRVCHYSASEIQVNLLSNEYSSQSYDHVTRSEHAHCKMK